MSDMRVHAMSEPVFSAEYAASLVQRARDGATFWALCLGTNGDGHDHAHDMPDSEWSDAQTAEYERRCGEPHPQHHWRPRRNIVGNHPSGDYSTEDDHNGAHWVAWYQETNAALSLAGDVDREPIDYGVDRSQKFGPMRAWYDAADELLTTIDRFTDSLNALGSLCQLPDEWTPARREAAREMRTR